MVLVPKVAVPSTSMSATVADDATSSTSSGTSSTTSSGTSTQSTHVTTPVLSTTTTTNTAITTTRPQVPHPVHLPPLQNTGRNRSDSDFGVLQLRQRTIRNTSLLSLRSRKNSPLASPLSSPRHSPTSSTPSSSSSSSPSSAPCTPRSASADSTPRTHNGHDMVVVDWIRSPVSSGSLLSTSVHGLKYISRGYWQEWRVDVTVDSIHVYRHGRMIVVPTESNVHLNMLYLEAILERQRLQG